MKFDLKIVFVVIVTTWCSAQRKAADCDVAR